MGMRDEAVSAGAWTRKAGQLGAPEKAQIWMWASEKEVVSLSPFSSLILLALEFAVCTADKSLSLERDHSQSPRC